MLGSNERCPHCKSEDGFRKGADLPILALRCRCPNEGCKWAGYLFGFRMHTLDCLIKKVTGLTPSGHLVTESESFVEFSLPPKVDLILDPDYRGISLDDGDWQCDLEYEEQDDSESENEKDCDKDGNDEKRSDRDSEGDKKDDQEGDGGKASPSRLPASLAEEPNVNNSNIL